jgi:hypothetical protein
VRAAGISWGVYDRFMQKYVKRDGHEKLTNVPADLDTKPYRDEHDVDLLRRMELAVERGPIPSARSRAAVHGAIKKAKDEMATRREAPRRATRRARSA